MAVSRNQRTYPLALKTDPLNVGIVAAYDWAAEDGSTAASNGKDHSGNSRNFTAPSPDPLIVQTAFGKGRDTSQNRTVAQKGYEAAGAVTVGLAVGTGDFTVWKRFRVPTYVPAAISTREIWRLADSGGGKLLINLLESTDVGGYRAAIVMGGVGILVWNAPNNPTLIAGSLCDIHITRISGVVKCYVNGSLITTVSGNSVDFLSTNGASKTINGNYSSGETNVDTVYLDDIYWNRGLSDSEVSAHNANPYAYYQNQGAANAITVAAPVAGATAGTTFTISGSYAGADSPTAIEASFNGGTWVVIDNTLNDGTYSGNLTGQTPGTGTLSVRWSNKPEVTTSVANITVASAGIAFTFPSPQLSVRPFRMFQRDDQNRANVRISGTYTGSPTAIEYRYNGGTWTVLDSAPAGGSFDKTVSLQGPAQGSIEIRFANATGVTASVAQVGVGDIFIIAGQSNHVGMSPQFVQPSAPAANPSWQSIVCAKDGVWKAHVETNALPFDDRTNALYPIQVNSAAPLGSYFGALATRIMATGVPVAFVPCALGSSSLTQWAINTGTDWLYGAALARAALVGNYRALLWWQGEAETGSTDSKEQLVVKYGDRVNDWFARTGKKWFIWAIDGDENGANFPNVHDALIEVGQTNPNCAGWADMLGAFNSGIHYEKGSEINEIANRAFSALNQAYTYEVDNSHPVLSGNVTVTNITQTTATLSWPEAVDNVSVTGYEYRINSSGSFINNGNSRTANITGLSPSTTYQPQVQAFDAVGNRSMPISSTVPFSTLAAEDTIKPVFNGSLTFTSAIGGGTVSWPAATDNVGIARYERQIDGGSFVSTGLTRTATFTGLNAGGHSVNVRAVDAAGNYSDPLSGSLVSLPDEQGETPDYIASKVRTIKAKAGGGFTLEGPFWSIGQDGLPSGRMDPDSEVDITMDWTDVLSDISDTIASGDIEVLGATATNGFTSEQRSTVFIDEPQSSGVTIRFRMESASVPPRVEDRTVKLTVAEQ